MKIKIPVDHNGDKIVSSVKCKLMSATQSYNALNDIFSALCTIHTYKFTFYFLMFYFSFDVVEYWTKRCPNLELSLHVFFYGCCYFKKNLVSFSQPVSDYWVLGLQALKTLHSYFDLFISTYWTHCFFMRTPFTHANNLQVSSSP